MFPCPACGQQLTDETTKCPACGVEISSAAPDGASDLDQTIGDQTIREQTVADLPASPGTPTASEETVDFPKLSATERLAARPTAAQPADSTAEIQETIDLRAVEASSPPPTSSPQDQRQCRFRFRPDTASRQRYPDH